MKKLLYLIFIIVPVTLRAQNWALVNTNTTDDIIDVYFKDNSLGFFLTNTGKIFHSHDSGDNWELIHQDTDLISGQLAITNDSIFWYASDLNGTPMKSQSLLSTFNFTKNTIGILPMRPIFWNNEIWDVLKVNQLLGGSAPSNFVVEEFAVSDNYIWATNSLIIYSSDDFGATWQEHQFMISGLTSGPYQSYYNGTNNMVAVTQYPTIIHKTTDGINWTSTDQGLNGIYFYFIDHSRYLAYNFFGITSKIYSTSDGGQIFSEEDLTDIPSGIYSRNNNSDVIFLYGKNGMLYKSTNGGGLSVNLSELKKKTKSLPKPRKRKNKP